MDRITAITPKRQKNHLTRTSRVDCSPKDHKIAPKEQMMGINKQIQRKGQLVDLIKGMVFKTAFHPGVSHISNPGIANKTRRRMASAAVCATRWPFNAANDALVFCPWGFFARSRIHKPTRPNSTMPKIAQPKPYAHSWGRTAHWVLTNFIAVQSNIVWLPNTIERKGKLNASHNEAKPGKE